MNKSATYDKLYITINKLENTGVRYSLAASSSPRVFRWIARTVYDRLLMMKLDEGKTYSVSVYTDRRGTQHWTDAKEVIVERTAPAVSVKRRTVKRATETAVEALVF